MKQPIPHLCFKFSYLWESLAPYASFNYHIELFFCKKKVIASFSSIFYLLQELCDFGYYCRNYVTFLGFCEFPAYHEKHLGKSQNFCRKVTGFPIIIIPWLLIPGLSLSLEYKKQCPTSAGKSVSWSC